MGAYKYISNAWNKRSTSALDVTMRQNAIRWRHEPSILRIPRPTRIDRARRLGYRAKQGFVITRVRIRKGGARKIRPSSGRRPKALGVSKFTRAKSLKQIAEDRTARKFPNMKALNSYWVYEDGRSAWFEVVLMDKNHPVTRTDPHLEISED
jgi:large subunit ribosomal protein L15e